MESVKIIRRIAKTNSHSESKRIAATGCVRVGEFEAGWGEGERWRYCDLSYVQYDGRGWMAFNGDHELVGEG